MAPVVAAGLLMGAIKTGEGAIEEAQGKAMAKRNVRPKLNQSGIYDNLLGLMEQQGQYGLGANALTFASNNQGNAFTSGLNALMMAGGDPNMVSNLYGDYAGNLEKLAIADSDRRWQKVAAISSVTDKLATSRQEEFLYNVDAPFKDAAQAAAEKVKSGYKEKMGGLDMIGNAFINGQTGGLYDTGSKTAAAGAADTGDASSIDSLRRQLSRKRKGDPVFG